jgi:hypothetical protein
MCLESVLIEFRCSLLNFRVEIKNPSWVEPPVRYNIILSQ